jgi:predicted transcriptional regulator
MTTSAALTSESAPTRSSLRSNEEKWSPALMAAGWTAVPSIILEKQFALGLDALDINILLQLSMYWWQKDNLPHPSKKTLAKAMNVDASTVRRRITRMVKDGLIERIERHDPNGGQQSNYYRFDKLIAEALPHAQEAVMQKQQHQAEKQARQSRKKAGPILIKNPFTVGTGAVSPNDGGKP